MALFKEKQTVYFNRDTVIGGIKKGQAAKVLKVLDGKGMSLYMARKKGLTLTIPHVGETRVIKVKVKLINPPQNLRDKDTITLSENMFY